MTYILSAQRNLDDEAEAMRLWNLYRQYLRENETKFPPGAFSIASSDWYYGFDDHRAPHDAWLETATFSEPATGERSEVRHLSLRLRLLGAYHDRWLEFFYPKVFAYEMSGERTGSGHGDWLYDEFRLSSKGRLLHEIEWAGKAGSDGSRWLIEASDVEFTTYERGVYAGELSTKLANYRALGQKEGSKNRPAQDAAVPDQHEGALRSEAESWLSTEQRLFDMQLVESSKGATEAKQKVIELRATVDQLVNDDSARSTVDAELAGDRSELVKTVEQRLRTEVAYRYFRAHNDIHDEPHYPDSVLWHFGVLAVLGLIETVTNAFFYENSQGLLGGFFVALGIAALNMGTAMFLGNWFRYKNLASIDKKVMGWLALAAFLFTTILFNALFASFRTEYQLVADPTEFKEVAAAFQRAWPEAMRIFRADMQFRDLWSFLLFGLGILLSIAAFWKGYTLDDKYPGHGHVAKELKKAVQAEHELQNQLRHHHLKYALHGGRRTVVGPTVANYAN